MEFAEGRPPLQLGVRLGQRQQGRRERLRAAAGGGLGAERGDRRLQPRLVVAITLDAGHQRRDEVGPPLQLHVDERPGLLDAQPQADEAVVHHPDPAGDPRQQVGEAAPPRRGAAEADLGAGEQASGDDGEQATQHAPGPVGPFAAGAEVALLARADDEHLRARVLGDLRRDDVRAFAGATAYEQPRADGHAPFEVPATSRRVVDRLGRPLLMVERVAAVGRRREQREQLDLGALGPDPDVPGLVLDVEAGGFAAVGDRGPAAAQDAPRAGLPVLVGVGLRLPALPLLLDAPAIDRAGLAGEVGRERLAQHAGALDLDLPDEDPEGLGDRGVVEQALLAPGPQPQPQHPEGQGHRGRAEGLGVGRHRGKVCRRGTGKQASR